MGHHMQSGGSPSTWAKDIILNQKFSNFDNQNKGNVQEGIKEDETTKLSTKVILFFVGIGFLVATVLNYKYLGGIQGIISFEMLEAEGDMINYVTAVACLVIFPIISVLCLVKVFKRKKID